MPVDPVSDEDDVRLWMPLFGRDFLADTADLDEAEGGAYAHLLIHMWLHGGSLPTDPERLRRLAKAPPERWPGEWNRIRDYFTERDGRLYQKRLLKEFEEAVKNRRARRERTRKATEARTGKNVTSDVTVNVTSDVGPNVTRTPAPAPAPAPAPVTATTPAHAPAVARARAREEDQGNSQDHCTQPDAGAPALTTDRSLDTRTALHPDALRIADLWAKHRRQVDPKDPIVERGRWATDRETMAGTLTTHVERHGVDTVTAVIEWGMRHVDGEFSWQAQLDSPESVEAALTKGRIVSQWRAAQEAAKRAGETGHVRSRRDARAPAELEAERQAREREAREREQREARWREEAAANPLTPELRDRIKRQVLGGGG